MNTCFIIVSRVAKVCLFSNNNYCIVCYGICVSGRQKMAIAKVTNHHFFPSHICMWLATHPKSTLILIDWIRCYVRRHYYIVCVSRFTYYWAPLLTISANDSAGSSTDWILLMMSCGKRFQSLTVFKLNFSISVLARSLR